MAQVQYIGTGRRKSSTARVRLVPGEGNIVINNRACRRLRTIRNFTPNHQPTISSY